LKYVTERKNYPFLQLDPLGKEQKIVLGTQEDIYIATTRRKVKDFPCYNFIS